MTKTFFDTIQLAVIVGIAVKLDVPIIVMAGAWLFAFVTYILDRTIERK